MNTITKNFINDYTEQVINDNAAIFAGAGLSKVAGFVDWKGLLRSAAEELELDIEKENDLVSMAQYYVNKNGRPGINSILGNEFLQDKEPGENHRILARLPITTYWTTNYDSLIEDALKEEGKIVDCKHCNEHLSRSYPNRNAVVYKMHGDKSNPNKAVLIKDDYDKYYREYAPFVTALCGELISKTFLFIGFSFEDPNLDYILSRMRVEYGDGVAKQHYAIFRKVNRNDYSEEMEYLYDLNKQKLFFEDLTKRYHIKPIVVDEYSEITEILKCIERKINSKNIFISGSAEEYGQWEETEAKDFIQLLSENIIARGYNIVSGFGLGVGSYVITGALNQIYMKDRKIDDKRLLLRPFPQGIVDENTRKALWKKYREDMISHSGIAIFIYGNKKDKATGKIVDADGMYEEFEIAKNQGKLIVPIGCTGYVAERIWNELSSQFETFYRNNSPELRIAFEELNKKDTVENLISKVLKFIQLVNSI